jgi:threonine aldolase
MVPAEQPAERQRTDGTATGARRYPSPTGGEHRRELISDNNAGVHPQIVAAIQAANSGHVPAYGADPYTAHAQGVFREHFGPDADAYFVFNGTGANVLALHSMAMPWESVICADTAHIHSTECGALEHVSGVKLLPVPGELGKLTPQLIETRAHSWGRPNRPQPRVVSITQSTELGTCYSIEEMAEISRVVHGYGMTLHVDGARFANAAATLGTSLEELSSRVGVDVLSFGGTKLGLLFGEAVVVLNRSAVRGTEYLRKAVTQLASKMRFIAVQFASLLSSNLWYENAAHANRMAKRLEQGIGALPAARIAFPVEANEVFVELPQAWIAAIGERRPVNVVDDRAGRIRLVTSYDTDEADIDRFLADARAVQPADLGGSTAR